MSYTINVTYQPSGSSFYVRCTNLPSTIEPEETVVLNFIADGTYYIFKTDSISATGATAVWNRTSTTQGTLTISNATANVVVTAAPTAKVIPQSILKPFSLSAAAPIDTRLVLTKAQMKDTRDITMPDYYLAVCKENSDIYIYDKSATVDAETGKFRQIDEYLKFETAQARANLDAAIQNTATITGIKSDVENVKTRLSTVETDVTKAKEDIVAINSWIENVTVDGGEIKAQYDITNTLTNVTMNSGSTKINYKSETAVKNNYVPNSSDYKLPDTITVNGTTVNYTSTDYTKCDGVYAKWEKGDLLLKLATKTVSVIIVGLPNI